MNGGRLLSHHWVPVVVPLPFVLVHFILQALTFIPAPDGDAIWFYPVALESGMSGLLAHPFRSPVSVEDFRFTWHGWLYPAVLGGFVRILGVAGLFVGGLFLALVTHALFVRQLRHAVGGPWWISGAILVILANMLLVYPGRPEALAVLFLVAGMAVALSSIGGVARHLLVGVILGFMAATQPVAALLSLVLYSLYSAYGMPFRCWLRALALVGVASAVVLCLLLAVHYPHGVGEWLRGLILHGEGQRGRGDGFTFRGVFFYLVRNPANPLALLWVISLPVLLLFWTRPRCGSLYWGLSVLLALFLWYFALRIPAHHYNFFVLLPAWLLLWGVVATRHRAGAVLLLVMTALALSALGYRLLGQLHSIAAGGPYAELVEAVGGAGPVTVHDSHFMLLYEPRTAGNITFEEGAEWLLLKQAHTGMARPPVVDGHELVEDNFAPPLRLLGLPLFSAPHGYQYALYRRSQPAKENSPR